MIGIGIGLGKGVVSFVGLLDSYPTASMAYSLRKLRGNYSGPAIQVRRSIDNNVLNIGFTALGNLDTTALTSFCGAGDGFVTTWYDQSGNGNNATQSTAANQPQIVSSGSVISVNSNPSIKFDGINDRLFSNFFPPIAQPYTLFNVRKYNNNNTQISICLSSTTPYGDIYFSSGTFQAFAGGSFIDSGVSVNLNQGLWYFLGNTTNSQVLLNNGTIVTSSLGNEPFTQVYMGGTNSSFDTNVNLQELIIYPSNQSSNRSNISTNINTYYDIY